MICRAARIRLFPDDDRTFALAAKLFACRIERDAARFFLSAIVDAGDAGGGGCRTDRERREDQRE